MAKESDVPPKIGNESPIEYLQRVANDKMLPVQIRLDAAKALLPYTAKKTSETLETVNRNYTIRDERLAVLNDDDLRALIGLVKKIADVGDDGTGTPEAEV